MAFVVIQKIKIKKLDSMSRFKKGIEFESQTRLFPVPFRAVQHGFFRHENLIGAIGGLGASFVTVGAQLQAPRHKQAMPCGAMHVLLLRRAHS
ncbi:MAG: hypothetical protein OEY75_06690 [Hylemonella sp.]|nr:hypothetical protein [Hylemonella sp.]MDH5708786.1 hypothetical protein [Hylemonella sp.]